MQGGPYKARLTSGCTLFGSVLDTFRHHVDGEDLNRVDRDAKERFLVRTAERHADHAAGSRDESEELALRADDPRAAVASRVDASGIVDRRAVAAAPRELP